MRVVGRTDAAFPVRGALIAAALACAAAILAAPAAAAPAKSAAKGPRTLVVKKAHNPVFKALKRRGEGLRVERTPPRRHKRTRHELLVLDGDELSARRMARRRELKDFSNGGRWVLALDVGSRHHKRALAKHTGFEALANGRHESRSFLFRHTVVDGVPRTLMLDTERLAPRGAAELARKQRRKSKRAEANRVADLIAERVSAGDDELAQLAGAAAPQDSIPPEALVVGYSYQVTGTHHPKDGHVPSGPGNVPRPGYQDAQWTMNHNFTVYLDNSVAHPQGDFQIVTYDLSGSFNPQRDGTAFYQNFDEERAWFTGLINPSVAPADAATDGKLTWQANEPQTPNQETETSSSDGFDVGFSASKSGPGFDASYHATHGQSFQIQDWGVASSTSGNRASWEFSSRNPCDPRPQSNPTSNCFGIQGGLDKFPNIPNGLSSSQITVDTSARWRTKQLLTHDGGQGNLSFIVNTPVTLYDIWCKEATSVIGCSQHGFDTDLSGPAAQNLTFDVSDAIPVGIESVVLDPTQADGSKNQNVKGTVTLERAAPFDTTISLFSSKENAVVGRPITDQISRGSVTVNKGETEGTFKVQTNDNDMNPGDHITAYITAFYGGPSQPVPLRIISE
jgi:hypothetical protein